MESELIFILVLLSFRGYPCHNNTPDGIIVPIGSIFSSPNELGIQAFKYTLSHFNMILTNPFALSYYVDSNIDVSDSFALASRICERMENGVFLFFGVKNTKSLDIVQSITRTFHMPYLSPSTSMWTEKSEGGFEVHLKPDYSFAIVDMIGYFGWNKVHYVYDSDEGLQHIQVVLAELRHMMEADHMFHVSVVARRIYNVAHAHDELRQLDRMDPNSSAQKVIVFDLSTEQAYKDILRQIPEVGMNKDGYHYLIATLDFANMDMRRYLHGGVNITGFQLLDLESEQLKEFMKKWNDIQDDLDKPVTQTLTYEAALAVDAVHVITGALMGMVKNKPKVFQSTFRRKRVYNYNKTAGVPCTTTPAMPWMHGQSIMEHIKMLDFEGLTGRLKFDEDGFRTGYKLDVYTVGLDNGPTKIGHWTQERGFHNLYQTEEEPLPSTDEDKPKIVTTILSPPFLMKKELDDSNGKPLVGNDRFKGYVVDLTKQIAEIIRFDYVFKLVPDETFGTLRNGTWDGMVGQLVYNKADVCIASLTITYDREKAVDFSKPFMNFGISIMIKKPEIMKPGVFSFMEPLETKIWICIVFAYCSVSFGLFLVSRFSPFEWGSAGPSDSHFTILNALWFAMGALMLQGSDACPRSFSGRVIGTVWWFFVLIIISSYTANLAAFLTIERMQTPIESADDLVKQTEIKYGTLMSGSTKEFFKVIGHAYFTYKDNIANVTVRADFSLYHKDSQVPTYQKMWQYMEANPSVFAPTTGEGIERVKKSKGKYAFLLESTANEYTNSKEPCDTIKVGPHLNSKGFGIATPKESPLSEQVNLAVLMLMEDGTLPKLKIKWWKDKGVCGAEGKESSGKRELSLSNVAGIFYILVGGLAIAVVLASVEFLYSKPRFLDKGPYLKATETVTTLLSASANSERENGEINTEHAGNNSNNYNDRQEFTYNYSSAPPCIGFEQYNQINGDQ